MQLDETEEDLKGQHDLDQGPDSPTQTEEATHYFDMNFMQLCDTNDFGGDPRLYEYLKEGLIQGQIEEDEEMAKLFDISVLVHLTSNIGNKNVSQKQGNNLTLLQPLGIREKPNGRLYFAGFPDFDYVRQVSSPQTAIH